MGVENSGSFIPKRSPVRRPKSGGSRQIYLFAIFSYISIFASVIAAAGVFLYGQYIERTLTEEIAALDVEIQSFDQPAMDEVLAFEDRLEKAAYRFDRSISMQSLLAAVEEATIITAQITDFEVSRESDEQYLVAAELATDSFDSTIFQRGVLERDAKIAAVTISEVTTATAAAENDEANDSATSDVTAESAETVTFKAELLFSIDDIPLEVTAAESDVSVVESELSPDAPQELDSNEAEEDGSLETVDDVFEAEPVTETSL